jgi:hypothetical protein
MSCNGRPVLLVSVVRVVRFLCVQASRHCTECNSRLTLCLLHSRRRSRRDGRMRLPTLTENKISPIFAWNRSQDSQPVTNHYWHIAVSKVFVFCFVGRLRLRLHLIYNLHGGLFTFKNKFMSEQNNYILKMRYSRFWMAPQSSGQNVLLTSHIH